MNNEAEIITSSPLFSVRALTKIFPGPVNAVSSSSSFSKEETGIAALDGIDLDIFPGECLLVAGSNGSGKTVLMKIIAGLLEPSGGELSFRGRPLGAAARELRSSLGLVFQDAGAQFVGETVEEDAAFGPKNLGFSKTEAAERAKNALRAMGLEDKASRPPRRLSGGEKRRLAVAGILAMGCEAIIFDEPFANLDWPGVVQTLEMIRSLKAAGTTLVVLTHELEKVLALADRLVILHQGRIRDEGKPAAVLDRLRPEYGVRDPRRDYRSVEDCTWLD